MWVLVLAKLSENLTILLNDLQATTSSPNAGDNRVQRNREGGTRTERRCWTLFCEIDCRREWRLSLPSIVVRPFYKLLSQDSCRIKTLLQRRPPRMISHSARDDYPVLARGTAIGIDHRRSTRTNKFTALLGHIRNVYAKAVRDTQDMRVIKNLYFI